MTLSSNSNARNIFSRDTCPERDSASDGHAQREPRRLTTKNECVSLSDQPPHTTDTRRNRSPIWIPKGATGRHQWTFSYFQSLSSISFESPPQLKRIESHAFDGFFCTIVIPCTVLFVASDLGVHHSQLLFAEGHSCEEFDGWLRIRKSGISVDF
jgi:hypothetical protein